MGKPVGTIECTLPAYQPNKKKWRRAILGCAVEAARAKGIVSKPTDQVEVVVLLYLTKGHQFDKHDVDNRLKDILDALQGAFKGKSSGKKRDPKRLIKNDRHVCRVVIEKQHVPLKYKHRSEAPGGRLLIRPYRTHRWPLQ